MSILRALPAVTGAATPGLQDEPLR